MNFNEIKNISFFEKQSMFNKLNLEEKKEYVRIYNVYRKIFTEYVINKINLIECDERIQNSKLNFVPIKEEKMDIYQYFSANIMKYFYIRNNIYINNLTENEKKFLKTNSSFNEETIKMVENSYKRVVCWKTHKENEKINIFYGPLSKIYSSPIDNIVIGVRFDEFNTNGLNEDEWEKLYYKQNEYLHELMEEIRKKTKEVTVIQYDDFSIIPRE